MDDETTRKTGEQNRRTKHKCTFMARTGPDKKERRYPQTQTHHPKKLYSLFEKSMDEPRGEEIVGEDLGGYDSKEWGHVGLEFRARRRRCSAKPETLECHVCNVCDRWHC